MTYSKFTPAHQKFLCASASTATPYTYKQAAQDSNWLQAMKLELHGLESNNTWELVQKPPNQLIVDRKWLFKGKYLPNGDIDRYKARLVAKGFTNLWP